MSTFLTYYHTLLIDNGFGSRQRLLFRLIRHFRLPSKVHSELKSIQQSHHLLLSVISLKTYSSFSSVFAFDVFDYILPFFICLVIHFDFPLTAAGEWTFIGSADKFIIIFWFSNYHIVFFYFSFFFIESWVQNFSGDFVG